MKNLLFSLLAIITLISCRNSDFETSKSEDGQFGFSFSRNNDFQPSIINEKNTINLNLSTNYDFSSIKTYFKYSNNLAGTLKFNGVTVNPNNQYQFTQKNNVFEYTGSAIGTHEVKFDYFNEKGITKTDDIKLVYDSSKVSFQGGQAANILFKTNISGGWTQLKIHGINRFFKASTTGGGVKIKKIIYKLKFDTKNPYNNTVTNYEKIYIQDVQNGSNTIQANLSDVFSTNDALVTSFSGYNIIIENIILNIQVVNSDDAKKSVDVASSYSFVP